MEISLKAHYLGFKITEVPTVWRERTRGNLFLMHGNNYQHILSGIFGLF